MQEDNPRVVSDEIRYQGKAIHDEQWIIDFLTDQKTGVLGLINDDEPHLVTQLFVYNHDDTAIYLHGAQDGQAYDIVKRDEPAAATFTTHAFGRFIPAEQPVNFTVEYASVVANGTISLIGDATDKRGVLEQVMEKFAPHLTPGEDYQEISNESINRTAVYRLNVESWSAKQGKKDPDHPGAYDLD